MCLKISVLRENVFSDIMAVEVMYYLFQPNNKQNKSLQGTK